MDQHKGQGKGNGQPVHGEVVVLVRCGDKRYSRDEIRKQLLDVGDEDKEFYEATVAGGSLRFADPELRDPAMAILLDYVRLLPGYKVSIVVADHWDSQGQHGCKRYAYANDDSWDRHVRNLRAAAEVIMTNDEIADHNERYGVEVKLKLHDLPSGKKAESIPLEQASLVL